MIRLSGGGYVVKDYAAARTVSTIRANREQLLNDGREPGPLPMRQIRALYEAYRQVGRMDTWCYLTMGAPTHDVLVEQVRLGCDRFPVLERMSSEKVRERHRIGGPESEGGDDVGSTSWPRAAGLAGRVPIGKDGSESQLGLKPTQKAERKRGTP